ncbi:TOBE domain-containing protein [Tomitella gaofuii]|uniref:TOBE domain-containing protein n=1 Tax=Tomitella gaofuii TaxID=2760083 RepID=UPI0015FB5F23
MRVTAVEARGDAIRVRASGGPDIPLMAEMTATAARELGIAAGDEAVFVVKASEVRVYPG